MDQKNKKEENIADHQKKAEEYLNNWKRAAADLANYKKGEIERAGLLVEYAKEGVFLNLVPILDSIYFAGKHGGFEGIDLVKKQIADFLKKEGIEEIKAVGEAFNPECMEAVEQVAGDEPEKVLEELQKGYLLNGKVLRPAKVKISI